MTIYYSGLVKRNHRGLIILSSWFESRIRNQQGDIMSEIKSNTKKIPNVPMIKNVGPKSAIKPKGPIAAKTAKPLRKAGRGR